MAPENTNVSAYLGDRMRFRVGIRGGGTDALSRGYTLAARLCNPECGFWVPVTDDGTVTGVFYWEF